MDNDKTKDEEKAEKIRLLNDLMNAYANLRNAGSKELADKVSATLVGMMSLISKKDWVNHQICADFPVIDPRCLIFCCSPVKNCVFRTMALKKLGLSDEWYVSVKKKLVKELMLCVRDKEVK